MKKYKTTKKAIKENYNTIISVGYCDLQYLLKYQNAFAYSERSEGWACDYYNIDDTIISTGCSPINSRNSSSNYTIEKKYNDIARSIIDDYELSNEEKQDKVCDLLIGYIEEVKN